ncbi:Interferon-induced 6-16 family [Rhizoctonia solani]|uniref:Interferon-induced 6-16 family n=1 Tax=Rhizoctonia solani TaxID=456999 RepID=A0A8H7IM13_9AGAM|nr:Interferon-induced 6-16 family [Rhizoctonia solani]
MAPVLPELFSQAVYSFKSYDWSSEALNASEKLAQVASDSNVLSAAWAWLLGVFASIGAFFATSWQYVGASEVSKEHIWEWFTASWQSLSEFLLRPDARNAIIVWFVVFWICVLIPLALGFGPVGVIGGSLAAWFQSVFMELSLRGGFFAVMTSCWDDGCCLPASSRTLDDYSFLGCMDHLVNV